MALAIATATPALAEPIQTESSDVAAVETVIESIANLADQSEFETLEKLFDDEVLVDYSSLNGAPAEIKSPQALMTEWASALPGFDRTRHDVSGIDVDVNGRLATATANVVADHWIDGQHWQVSGRYNYAFELDGAEEEGVWQVTSMTLTVTGEEGSRDVFDPAVEAANTDPAPYIQRQRTRQAVVDFLTGLEQNDMAKVNRVWAEDAVQDMPFATEGTPSRVVGREALIELYSGWPANAANPNFTDHLVIHPLKDPQMVFAEYRGRVDIIPTGREYKQTYGGLFHVNADGKITLFREYYDPRPFGYAFAIGE
ncbi:nuclear transport factor 2 family protein [Erythrobacter rubeus]|uniref:Nuclear transport factor 2 family protein n=1 Tax=Erythrobacter rubeus TaxID=2760803 RepID=A0ABR8KQG3_9SPHN|nr:nuclear transport factor 2 family protein [Erythrobacter rubeus]MBD2842144.1 nuclear transport factor 2 family protein [Erythrobacter rubeus]